MNEYAADYLLSSMNDCEEADIGRLFNDGFERDTVWFLAGAENTIELVEAMHAQGADAIAIVNALKRNMASLNAHFKIMTGASWDTIMTIGKARYQAKGEGDE